MPVSPRRLDQAVITYYCATADPSAVARREEYLGWLSQEEQQRYHRFAFPHVQWEFLLGHALLRRTLSEVGDDAPPSWCFSTEGNGKPCLAGDNEKQLEFNLSHTRGWVAVAVSRSSKVGVDVQYVRPRSIETLVPRVLAPWEVAFLDLARDPHDEFFRFWTLKEAYLKAVSIGLSTRLETFGFDLTCDPPALRFQHPDDRLSETPFHCAEHLPGDLVKLAAGCLADETPQFHFEYCCP